MSGNRWAYKALNWDPVTKPTTPGRKQARPKKRWNTDICKFLLEQGLEIEGNSWQSLAKNPETWNALENDF
eukprot:5688248-Karenia_brevis.AAC.1